MFKFWECYAVFDCGREDGVGVNCKIFSKLRGPDFGFLRQLALNASRQGIVKKAVPKVINGKITKFIDDCCKHGLEFMTSSSVASRCILILKCRNHVLPLAPQRTYGQSVAQESRTNLTNAFSVAYYLR